MKKFLFSLTLLSFNTILGFAQPALQNDFSYSLKIPSVVAMESSAAHLYVLSESEGMAVFRTHQDSLQWLYTAPGMQQRGHSIRADIRFAYLFGNSKRLTVLEPTSVLGAYSATTLPQKPLDALRFGENLYIALGPGGLGKLTLKTPQTLDSPIQTVDARPVQDKQIIDLTASTDKLFALSQNHQLFIFDKNERDISFTKSISLSQPVARIFFVNSSLMGATQHGDIVELAQDGSISTLGSIGEPVDAIKAWNDWLIIKGSSGRLWTSYQLTEPVLWKKNSDAGNYIAISKGRFWLCEYDRISQVRQVAASSNPAGPVSAGKTGARSFKIQPIANQIIPYPHALLIPLKLQNNGSVGNVKFSVQSDAQDVTIRGQSLYWKPKSSDSGQHQFKVVASTPGGQSASTSFTVDVQPFNTPPRFTPLRTISIPVDRPFSLPLRAIDPDGTNRNLIRYLGVNLPEGASVNEQTGKFTWTPTERQLGKKSFRVIATDQYGTAASARVSIRVIKTNSTEN